jgi:lysosomal acid lipase/cholesteryl ester hydrolase
MGHGSFFRPLLILRSLLSPYLFTLIMDLSIRVIFGYDSRNISSAQKQAAYAHLHSPTSMAVVVQWLQIIGKGQFPFDVASMKKIVPRIKILWGNRDDLVNIEFFMASLPDGTKEVGFADYEHIDLLWGAHSCEVVDEVLAAIKGN